MIKVENVEKYYGKIKALNGVSLTVKDGSIYGLIGTNGSGKSTVLRAMAGIFRAEKGKIEIDGENIYENPILKRRIVYISDDQFIIPSSTAEDVKDFYKNMYPNFDTEKFNKLTDRFSLDRKRQITGFSKGMKKQLDIISAVSSRPDYIYLDETFDGLDPVVREEVKRMLAYESAERGMSSVIASHNLREIEDICDALSLLHKGNVVISNDIDSIKTEYIKIQAIFTEEKTEEDFKELSVVNLSRSGSFYTIIARSDSFLAEHIVKSFSPVVYEVIPLTLEEVFITEMEEKGYGFAE